MLFKVGDSVRMTEIAKRRHSSDRFNPHDAVGTISKVRQETPTRAYRVQWPESVNGTDYQKNELELARD